MKLVTFIEFHRGNNIAVNPFKVTSVVESSDRTRIYTDDDSNEAIEVCEGFSTVVDQLNKSLAE